MFDETTDISHISQMTLVFRYVSNGGIREDFVKFADCQKEISQLNKNNCESSEHRLTGENLGQIVKNCLKQLDFDPLNCVGVTTDGCSVMTSESCGAVATLQSKTINAVYSPCHNHILNSSISKLSSVS